MDHERKGFDVVDREISEHILRLQNKTEELERRLRAANFDAMPSQINFAIKAHGRTAHQELVRSMILMEVVRQAGLLSTIDLEAIDSRVADRLAKDGDLPWISSRKTALKHIRDAFSELKGDYAATDAE